ncbi:MAG: deoxyribose-phosphate aldolase [Clostridia bacterium]|nr:deoxyribose-phosphate aldolase [Clostridia bacterium]
MLSPTATREMVERHCEQAVKYGFASVCCNSYWAQLVTDRLKGSGVKTCCVVGFPLGAMHTSAKAFETKSAVEAGAAEVDMVLNLGCLKGKDYDAVEEDIRAVVQAAKGAKVKVIIETCLLTEDEKRTACTLAVRAGADFVKTSTGFSTGGATAEDVALMRATVGGHCQVKASGGIRTPEQLRAMLDAGADRIGASDGTLLVAQGE